MGEKPKKLMALALCVAACIVLLGRYGAALSNDFVVDDWRFLAQSKAMPLTTIWASSIRDVLRPLNLAMTLGTFHLLGDHPELFALLRVVLSVTLMVACAVLVMELVGDAYITLLFLLLYGSLANLTESFHWASHVVLLYVPILYVTSVWFWIRHLRTGHRLPLIFSAICYTAGVYSYEYGVPFALVFVTIAYVVNRSTTTKAIAVFGGIALLYVGWRFTTGFGLGQYLLCGPEYLQGGSPTLRDLAFNVKSIFSWWVGGRMGRCYANGFSAFMNLPVRSQLLLVFLDAILVAAAGVHLARLRKGERHSQPLVSANRVYLIGLVWAATPYLPHILFTASARHNLFPGIGICLCLALLLSNMDHRRLIPVMTLFLALSLLANQGTGVSWREAGLFNRRLFVHLQNHEKEWSTKNYVLLDTYALRERQSADITKPATTAPSTWAYNRNAALLRGFAPPSMLRLIRANGPWPETILDVECNATISNGNLMWHERYDSSKPLQIPTNKIYVVDCLSAGSDQTP